MIYTGIYSCLNKKSKLREKSIEEVKCANTDFITEYLLKIGVI